jgi:hypothetical protein
MLGSKATMDIRNRVEGVRNSSVTARDLLLGVLMTAVAAVAVAGPKAIRAWCLPLSLASAVPAG